MCRTRFDPMKPAPPVTSSAVRALPCTIDLPRRVGLCSPAPPPPRAPEDDAESSQRGRNDAHGLTDPLPEREPPFPDGLSEPRPALRLLPHGPQRQLARPSAAQRQIGGGLGEALDQHFRPAL